MLENFRHAAGIVDAGDDAHLTAAERAQRWQGLIYPRQQHGPQVARHGTIAGRHGSPVLAARRQGRARPPPTSALHRAPAQRHSDGDAHAAAAPWAAIFVISASGVGTSAAGCVPDAVPRAAGCVPDAVPRAAGCVPNAVPRAAGCVPNAVPRAGLGLRQTGCRASRCCRCTSANGGRAQ